MFARSVLRRFHRRITTVVGIYMGGKLPGKATHCPQANRLLENRAHFRLFKNESALPESLPVLTF